jgi:hypothetical protein
MIPSEESRTITPKERAQDFIGRMHQNYPSGVVMFPLRSSESYILKVLEMLQFYFF